MSKFVIVVALMTLTACQGIVGPNGQISGVTVPAGCKAAGQVAFGGLQPPAGSIQFECDRTMATTPAVILGPKEGSGP